MTYQPWPARPACVGMDTNDFFPPDRSRGQQRRFHITDAQAVCAGCVVRFECLRDALDREERYGVFGGQDMEELTKRRGSRKARAELRQWAQEQLGESRRAA